MKRFCILAHLETKRMMRYAPFVFLVTLVICLCLALALVTMVRADNSGADQKKISVGIVGDFENSYLGFGISALKSFDSSRFSLDIVEYSEDEAREALFDREISGYVVIPEGFVDDALYGNIGKLSFVTTDANTDIINMFKQEILELISCILVESQNGVYGMQSAMLDYGTSYGEVMDMTDEMSIEYVALILSRSNALEVEVIGVSESLTFGGYMLSGLSVLLMLLSGIVCCPLFVRSDYALPKLMKANGYGYGMQILGEYISFFVLMTVNTLALLLLLMAGAGRASGIIPELAKAEWMDIFAILVKFIPAIALISALQYLLYGLSDSVVSGVLMQFVSAVLLGYVSGCFYPINFFPRAIRLVSDVLPSGLARGYLSSLLSESASLWQALTILIYTVGLLALAALVRHYRIRKA